MTFNEILYCDDAEKLFEYLMYEEVTCEKRNAALTALAKIVSRLQEESRKPRPR